jgi:hypothetical protein
MAAKELVPGLQGGPNCTVYGPGLGQLLRAEQEAFKNACQGRPDGEELLAIHRLLRAGSLKERSELIDRYFHEEILAQVKSSPHARHHQNSTVAWANAVERALRWDPREEADYTFSCPTKTENDKFFQRGFYGNKLRTWGSFEEWQASAYPGHVSIRYKEPQSPWCRYNVTPDHVPVWLQQFRAEGAVMEKFIFGEMAPDERLTIQGELHRSEKGLELFCSVFKGRMREALTNANGAVTFTGAGALAVLQTYLTGSSYSDLEELLEFFPDHVIEFSTYEMCLGSCRGRNSIVWEVRAY